MCMHKKGSGSASSYYFFQCIPTATLGTGISPVWDSEKEQLAPSQQLLKLGLKQGLSPPDQAPSRAERVRPLPTARLPRTGS